MGSTFQRRFTTAYWNRRVCPLKLQLEEADEYLIFPADSILHMKIDSIEVQEREGNNGSYKRLNFKFSILGIQTLGEGAPHPAEAYDVMIGSKMFGAVSANFTTSPNNKLRQWTEAILGLELAPGFELDTDLLVGRKVRGVTGIWTGTKVDVATGNVKSGHQINALLPSGANGVPAAAPPQQWVQQAPVQSAPAQQWAQPAQPVAQPVAQQWNAQPDLDPWGAPPPF